MSSFPTADPMRPVDPLRTLRWRSCQLAHHEQLAPGVVLTLLRIPEGSFLMGASEEEQDSVSHERPVHRVQLGEFLMGQTPVTQAQWRVVAEWLPREGEPPWQRELNPTPSRFPGSNRPVENVRWQEAEEFCRRLRQRKGKNYVLPSEAQWEYACRAGTTTPFHFGATLTTELANYNGSNPYENGPKAKGRGETTVVASFPANAWGLHDMHGNVWEWCADHWPNKYPWQSDDSHFLTEENTPEAAFRLVRGGAWDTFPARCRSAYRGRLHPQGLDGHVGFRVCCLPQD
ncbi:MAG: formylglycine-generating enzyme family protein [Cyanobacteriota bacterium]